MGFGSALPIIFIRRIIKCLGLEETSKTIYFQLICCRQGCQFYRDIGKKSVFLRYKVQYITFWFRTEEREKGEGERGEKKRMEKEGKEKKRKKEKEQNGREEEKRKEKKRKNSC